METGCIRDPQGRGLETNGKILTFFELSLEVSSHLALEGRRSGEVDSERLPVGFGRIGVKLMDLVPGSSS